jgi:anti-sigma-K factor RskA
MNLNRHPELADRLAAAYALGTLRGGARRRFEALARQNPTLRAGALVWQERLSAMTELQAREAPSPNV